MVTASAPAAARMRNFFSISIQPSTAPTTVTAIESFAPRKGARAEEAEVHHRDPGAKLEEGESGDRDDREGEQARDAQRAPAAGVAR